MFNTRVRRILKVTLLACLVALALGIVHSLLIPDISRLRSQEPEATAFMKFRRAKSLQAGKKRPHQYFWVPLSSISPYLQQAVVIAEDDKFWSHRGFDLEAIREAAEKNIRRRSLRYGGSTITQQLAKNLYLSPSRNPIRKLREFILTWRLERSLSKKRILELYLNVVEWGDGIFGAEAAARHHFDKPASALRPREAVSLAVILPSPRRYDPLSGTKFIESRIEDVLAIMIRRGIVAREEVE